MTKTSLATVHEAIVGCNRCERLRTYCERIGREKRAAYRDEMYWAKPVPGFGDPRARVVVVGLAPAAHGANRTGRVFTGDGVGGSGDFLMRAMHAAGFANLTTSHRPDDGLQLTDAYIAAAVRCAPPDNKPTTDEIAACHVHLVAEIATLRRAAIYVALGRIAFDSAIRVLGERGVTWKPRPIFGHGLVYLSGSTALVGSYHPSRQNTNTGKLTPRMLADVFRTAARLAKQLG